MTRDGNEPRWARNLRFWVSDEQYDSIMHLPDEHWQWKWRERLETVVLRAMCLVFGHGTIPDQCGIPEHRYCFRCSKHMPNAKLMEYVYR